MSTMTKVADIPQQILDITAKELILDYMPRVIFRQFVDYKLQFGTQPGERIKFTKLDNLPTGDEVLADEDATIPKHKMTGSEKFVTLIEMGKAVGFSLRAKTASYWDLMAEAKLVLGRNYQLVLDQYLRDTFLKTLNKYYVAADSTSGLVPSDAVGTFNVDTVEALVETAKTLRIPKFQGRNREFYVFVGTPRQLRQLRSNTNFIEARKYTDPSDMLYGEAGMMSGCVFIESDRLADLVLSSADLGTAEDVHRGIFLGANAVGYGESIPMSLIPGSVTPTEANDFGRKLSIAWHTIAGADIINDNIIEVFTSAKTPKYNA